MSSSHDDTILIWDFLNFISTDGTMAGPGGIPNSVMSSPVTPSIAGHRSPSRKLIIFIITYIILTSCYPLSVNFIMVVLSN